MQNKGLIKLFAFLFGLVSIYQLSYTFITNNVEKKAATYATNSISSTETDYLDQRKDLEVKE